MTYFQVTIFEACGHSLCYPTRTQANMIELPFERHVKCPGPCEADDCQTKWPWVPKDEYSITKLEDSQIYEKGKGKEIIQEAKNEPIVVDLTQDNDSEPEENTDPTFLARFEQVKADTRRERLIDLRCAINERLQLCDWADGVDRWERQTVEKRIANEVCGLPEWDAWERERELREEWLMGMADFEKKTWKRIGVFDKEIKKLGRGLDWWGDAWVGRSWVEVDVIEDIEEGDDTQLEIDTVMGAEDIVEEEDEAIKKESSAETAEEESEELDMFEEITWRSGDQLVQGIASLFSAQRLFLA